MRRKELFGGCHRQIGGTLVRSRKITLTNSRLRFDLIEIPTRLDSAEIVIGFNPVGKVDRNRPDSCMLHVILDSLRVLWQTKLPVP
jgi:hypothetical protein